MTVSTVTLNFGALALVNYGSLQYFSLNGVLIYPPAAFVLGTGLTGHTLGGANSGFATEPNALGSWAAGAAPVDPAIIPTDSRWGAGGQVFVLNDANKYVTQAVATQIFYTGNPYSPEVDTIRLRGFSNNPSTFNGSGIGSFATTQSVSLTPTNPNGAGLYCQIISVESNGSGHWLATLTLTLDDIVPPEPEVPEDTPAVIPRIVACGRGAFATAGCRQMC